MSSGKLPKESTSEKMNDSRYDKVIQRIKDLIIIIGVPLIVGYGLSLHSLQVESLKSQGELYKTALETQESAYKGQISALENQLAISNEHKDLLRELRYPDALQIIKAQSSLYEDEKKKLLKEIESSKESIVSFKKKVSALSRRPSIEEYNGLVTKYHELVNQFISLVDKQKHELEEKRRIAEISLDFFKKIREIYVTEPTGLPKDVLNCFQRMAVKYGITTIHTLDDFESNKRNAAYQDILRCIDSSNASEK